MNKKPQVQPPSSRYGWDTVKESQLDKVEPCCVRDRRPVAVLTECERIPRNKKGQSSMWLKNTSSDERKTLTAAFAGYATDAFD